MARQGAAEDTMEELEARVSALGVELEERAQLESERASFDTQLSIERGAAD